MRQKVQLDKAPDPGPAKTDRERRPNRARADKSRATHDHPDGGVRGPIVATVQAAG